jgi:hypothetical protein
MEPEGLLPYYQQSSMFSILSQTNPFQINIIYFSNIRLNIICV